MVMKTKSILDKYRKILAGPLGVSPNDIDFFVGPSNHHYVFKNNEINETAQLQKIKQIIYFEPEKDSEGNETGKQIKHTRWNNWSEGKYFVTVRQEDRCIEVSSFELYKLPHCCAVLVSCKANVNSSYRNRRIGTILNTFRQDIGRLLGYSTLMCTDIEQNEYQRRLLATNGWRDIYNVRNKRTNNRVFVSVIDL